MAAKEATAAVLERNATMTVLVVDDEESARNLCCEVAAESGMRAKGVATTEQALEVLDQHPIDIKDCRKQPTPWTSFRHCRPPSNRHAEPPSCFPRPNP